ncbi:excinuclease ABC subunit UvrA, partial [Vibrio parahaemolyticus]|nr:excinuclease ABC subunit UvrA [Vibrio parahaemolyticus]
EGIISNLTRRYRETQSDFMRDKIEEFMSEVPCPDCHGKRLKKDVVSIKINGLNISEVTDMPVIEALEFFENIILNEKETMIADQILKEIKSRLGFLVDVGLDYLTLSRMAGTLSGGESQ